MRLILPTVLVVFGLAACDARADGMFYKLPKDGASATFEFDATGKMEGDKQIRMKGTMRMASVGQVVENGQPCRWIEVAFEATLEGPNLPKEPQKEIAKILVPEKFLAKGQSPLEHVVRAWRKRSHEDKPTAWKEPQDIDEGPLPLLLSGPLKDAQVLKKADVESKLGKRACEGQSGDLVLKGERNAVFKAHLETRLHDDAPFGVVSSRWTLDIKGPETMTMDWNLKLIGVGDKAQSEIPDAK